MDEIATGMVYVFTDDILIFTKDKLTHYDILQRVVRKLVTVM